MRNGPSDRPSEALYRHCTIPQLLLLTATARKEKRIGTVENAHAKKLDKSMRSVKGKVDKHHLEYKGKTSLRPLPLFIGERGKKKASNP